SHGGEAKSEGSLPQTFRRNRADHRRFRTVSCCRNSITEKLQRRPGFPPKKGGRGSTGTPSTRFRPWMALLAITAAIGEFRQPGGGSHFGMTVKWQRCHDRVTVPKVRKRAGVLGWLKLFFTANARE